MKEDRKKIASFLREAAKAAEEGDLAGALSETSIALSVLSQLVRQSHQAVMMNVLDRLDEAATKKGKRQ